VRYGLLLRGSVALVLLGGWLVGCSAFVDNAGLAHILTWLGFIGFVQVAPAFLSPRADLFAPPIYYGVTGAFGTASSIAYLAGQDELRIALLGSVEPNVELAAAYRTVLALVIGLVAYYIGYYGRVGLGLRRWFPRVAGLVWDQGRMLVLSLLLAFAFAGAYVAFQLKVETSLFAVLEQATGKAAARDDPTLSWMLRGVQLGFVPVLLFIVHRLSIGARRRSLILPLTLLGVTVFLVSRLGGRGLWGYVLVAALVLFHYLRRRIPVMLFAALYFAGIILANALVQYRAVPESQRTIASGREIFDEPTSVLSAHETERMRFETLAVVMHQFPENEPYLLGKSWLALAIVPIPRWLWPEKVDYRDYQDNSLVFRISGTPAPTPYVGVLYANLSWIGIVMGMMGFGLFHRALYEWLRESRGDKSVVILYALTLICFTPTLLGLSGTLQYVVPVWAVIRLAGRRAASVTSPAPA